MKKKKLKMKCKKAATLSCHFIMSSVYYVTKKEGRDEETEIDPLRQIFCVSFS
jgi:hypothetical protein